MRSPERGLAALSSSTFYVNDNMKHTITALIFSLVLTIAVSSQPPRRTGPPIHQGPPPLPKSKVVSMADPLNDFATKGLGRTHIFGGVPDAALAESAAKLILANDDESLPALIGALQLAGFHIIDKDQKILFKPATAANGTAFFDYEVIGWVGFHLTGYSISGKGKLLGSFTRIIWDGIQSESSTPDDFGVRSISLVD